MMKKNVWMQSYGVRIGKLIHEVKEAHYKNDAMGLNLNEIVIMLKSCTTEITKLTGEIEEKDKMLEELNKTINDMLNGDSEKS